MAKKKPATKALVKREQAIQASSPTPADLLRIAVDKEADVEKLEKLLDLQMRWEANEAHKAFNAAMAAFKADPPEILKDQHVNFKTSKGPVDYKHASLSNVVKSTAPVLSTHGLNVAWKTDQQNGSVKVTCVITHNAGHFESSSLMASPDNSGGKNAIQAIGSAVTYLQRYTLLSILGLSTAEDDDGRAACKPQDQKPPKQQKQKQQKQKTKPSGKPEFATKDQLRKLREYILNTSLPSDSRHAIAKKLEKADQIGKDWARRQIASAEIYLREHTKDDGTVDPEDDRQLQDEGQPPEGEI